MKSTLCALLLAILLSACHVFPPVPTLGPLPTLALINGMLIDGTGGEPIYDAVVIVRAGRIEAAGPATSVTLPADAQVIDVHGGTILPGLINAHVHEAFSPFTLRDWTWSGITTVRDMGIQSYRELNQYLTQRENELNHPVYARLVAVGKIITVPGGYGVLFATTVEDARRVVREEIYAGVDLVKFALEDGNDPKAFLPNLTESQAAAIVAEAHQSGRLVTAHITQAKYLDLVIRLGVDDIAHIPDERLSDEQITAMVTAGMQMTTTFSLNRDQSLLETRRDNLIRFVRAGGEAVMGNDYMTYSSQVFEGGIPFFELEMMRRAGMTPLQIITASTHNAAKACGLEDELGTLQPGKQADILVVWGNPLENIRALEKVEMVIHEGFIIRQESHP